MRVRYKKLIETFVKTRKEWLKKFIELLNGFFHHDIFRRLISRLNPKEFQNSFELKRLCF